MKKKREVLSFPTLALPRSGCVKNILTRKDQRIVILYLSW